jgi:hypothetical protein
MKKITKLFLVILSAASLNLSAFAGDLNVTGGVTATITQGNGDSLQGKGLGISNELAFNANGEVTSGYTWKWQMELDGASTANDDTRLELTTPSAGTFAMYISEGDLSSKLGYGIGAMGVGSDYTNTYSTATGNNIWGKNISSYNNIQYHTPADLLPIGTSIKIGYAPNLSSAAGSSAKDGGAQETKAKGDSVAQYKVTMAPVDGLSVGGDYMIYSGGVKSTYDESSGGLFAKYALGAFTVGGATTRYEPAKLSTQTTGTVNYESKMYGVQFAVNDALSISYSKERFDKKTSKYNESDANVEDKMSSEHVQAAYVIGGATLGIAVIETDDVNFVKEKSAKKTTFSVALAF